MKYMRLSIEIVLIIALALSIYWNLWQRLQIEALQADCGAFVVQSSAQEAYKMGNTGLDGNMDGIACNSLQ